MDDLKKDLARAITLALASIPFLLYILYRVLTK